MKKKNELQRHLIRENATVKDALAALNNLSGENITLFVTDDSGTLKGSVTDGDIRRALLKEASLESPVSVVMNRGVTAVYGKSDLKDKIAFARQRGIKLLPLIEEGRLTRVVDLKHIHASLPVDAVLMAGGRGERLRPLTDMTPKPLLEVGGKSIIDYNVEALERCGVENIFVTVNYLAEAIKNHFKRRDNLADIECVQEPCRLGTMGSVTLIENLKKEHILLMNSDLLTDIDFERFFNHHIASDADVTICAVPYTVSVPYAILRMEGDCVKGLEEKPVFNYLANAGVYLIRRNLLSRMEKGVYLDTPDFISEMINDGRKVISYPADGMWIDIGSPDDYRRANEIKGR